MKKRPKFEFTELFLAKADWHRTFVGIITRKKLANDSQIINAVIPVNENVIYAAAENEKILGKKLDDMVVLILDHKIMEIDPPAMFPTTLADIFGDDDIVKFYLN